MPWGCYYGGFGYGCRRRRRRRAAYGYYGGCAPVCCNAPCAPGYVQPYVYETSHNYGYGYGRPHHGMPLVSLLAKVMGKRKEKKNRERLPALEAPPERSQNDENEMREMFKRMSMRRKSESDTDFFVPHQEPVWSPEQNAHGAGTSHYPAPLTAPAPYPHSQGPASYNQYPTNQYPTNQYPAAQYPGSNPYPPDYNRPPPPYSKH